MKLSALPDPELEAALRALGERIDWPDAPDIAGDVTRALRHPGARPVPLPRTGRRWGRSLLIAAVLLLPVAGTAIAAVLLWDFGAILVEVAPPTAGPLPSANLDPAAVGRLITLSEAPAEVGFDPIYPDTLGPPDEVYAPFPGDPPYVALAWLPTDDLPRIPGTPWGALLFEVPGEDTVIEKDVFAGQVEPARVDGGQAVWAQGEHPLRIHPGESDPFLVTGNVLLWNETRFAMRLESLLERAEAVRIAESVIP